MKASKAIRSSCVAVSTLCFLAAAGVSAQVPRENFHAAYVLLAQGGDGAPVAFARAIIDPALPCPKVVGTGVSLPMTTRDNPHGFGVIVCEAAIPLETALSVVLSTADRVRLPTVRTNPSRVYVFGDTGCSAQSLRGAAGCPAGRPAEPFHTLASTAAEGGRPDLILHMGDYNYRGTPGHILFTEASDDGLVQTRSWSYDAGDGSKAKDQCEQAAGAGFSNQNAPNANTPDRWETWRDDFFSPAADLLTSAPWIFTRGNHELCSRAGPGWFYFLDASSNLAATDGPQRSCPKSSSEDPIDHTVIGETYAVDLGSLVVAVIDSANACDSFVSPEPFLGIYEDRFRQLGKLLAASSTKPAEKKAAQTWVIGHRPIFGITGYQDKESTACDSSKAYGCLNQTLQSALKSTLGTFPKSVDLLLSGHMHQFEAATFADGRPPQIVIGTSGVALATEAVTGEVSSPIDGASAKVVATGATIKHPLRKVDAFGYLDMELMDDGSWSAVLSDPSQSSLLALCGSNMAAKGSVCTLLSSP